MRTESSLVAQILQQRPQRETTSHKAEKPTVMEQNIAQLFGEVQVATKIINEIFVEGSWPFSLLCLSGSIPVATEVFNSLQQAET